VLLSGNVPSEHVVAVSVSNNDIIRLLAL